MTMVCWLLLVFVECLIRLYGHRSYHHFPFILFNNQALELVEVEYIPEKAELDGIDEEFRKVFEKFNFLDNAITEVKLWNSILSFVISFVCLSCLSVGYFLFFIFLMFHLIYTVILLCQANDRKDDSAPDTASKKKSDSDSEEEQDTQQKEKGISNKKKKVVF